MVIALSIGEISCSLLNAYRRPDCETAANCDLITVTYYCLSNDRGGNFDVIFGGKDEQQELRNGA